MELTGIVFSVADEEEQVGSFFGGGKEEEAWGDGFDGQDGWEESLDDTYGVVVASVL